MGTRRVFRDWLKNVYRKYGCLFTVLCILATIELSLARGLLFKCDIYQIKDVKETKDFRGSIAKWYEDHSFLPAPFTFYKEIYKIKQGKSDISVKDRFFIVGASTSQVFNTELLSEIFRKESPHQKTEIYKLALGGMYEVGALVYFTTHEFARTRGKGYIIWMNTSDDFLDTDFKHIIEDKTCFQFFYSPKLMLDIYGPKSLQLKYVVWHLKKFFFYRVKLLKYRKFITYLLARFFLEDDNPNYTLKKYTRLIHPKISKTRAIRGYKFILSREPLLNIEEEQRLRSEMDIKSFRKWAKLVKSHSHKPAVIVLPMFQDTKEGKAFLKQALTKEEISKLYDYKCPIMLKDKVCLEKMETFCKENDIPFINLLENDRFISALTWKDYWDPFHFNDNGQLKLANELYPIFSELACTSDDVE